MKGKILEKIQYPKDLKKIPLNLLPKLAREIREFIIENISKTGGHLGSNLGVVELTIALHRVFDTPKDRLIWDVGHQAYTHKILTGRKDRFFSIRQLGGLAPFPKKEESEYDSFSVGHSSTSISAAVGMAVALKKEKNPPSVVAIIGDGALGGGMAFEALNHAGDIKSNILVILNDNKMSISPNVGALGKHLARLVSSPSYISFREKGRNLLSKLPNLKKLVVKAESRARGLVTPGTFFEEIGFDYFGPIDGHDLPVMIEILENLKKIKGPKILHLVTKKGKGFYPAEKDRYSFHAIGKFNPKTGKKEKEESKDTYTDIFSKWLVEKASKEKKLHCITPAMCQGSGMDEFSRKFPDRFHDVGIAEQHALTFAAGLATQGEKPIVAIYSTFLQRAYDQLLHDIAFQKLNVLLAIDRAGIVGPDGATHAGIYDLSFLATVPNLTVMAPSSGEEFIKMLDLGFSLQGPVAIRYPRDKVNDNIFFESERRISLGKGRIIREGKEIAILSFGAMLENCLLAAEKLGTTLLDMRFVKPLDIELIKKTSLSHKFLITVEDNVISGGAGSAVGKVVLDNDLKVRIINLGFSEKPINHGKRSEILEEHGLSPEKILVAIENQLKKTEISDF